MDALIHVDDVSKRYDNDGPFAVEDVSFEIAAGEVRRCHGPVGQRQVDAAEPDRRA